MFHSEKDKYDLFANIITSLRLNHPIQLNAFPYYISMMWKGGNVMSGYEGKDGGYSNNTGSGFVLLVVLFILLIIVGASFIY